MPEPLKNVYDQPFLEHLAQLIAKNQKGFKQKQFVSAVLTNDWSELELKARMSRISDTLIAVLSEDFGRATQLLGDVAEAYLEQGRSGFEYMFLPEFVEKQGLRSFQTSMRAFERMTETGSAEFAIRPFIVDSEKKTLTQLKRWTSQPNEHLRRLASEGCRPRLPWAMALPAYKRDPEPILPILEKLKNDSSLYVRRSVANNLNDISKDNPDIALTLAAKWQGTSAETDWLVKHACRGLLKAGHPDALRLFGLAPPDHIKISDFGLSKPQLVFGEAQTISFALTSAKPIGMLRLEYGVDFVKANGSLSRKMFKISEGEYDSKTMDVQKTHKFVPISTRVHHGGAHQIAIIVNGIELAKSEFELIMP